MGNWPSLHCTFTFQLGTGSQGNGSPVNANVMSDATRELFPWNHLPLEVKIRVCELMALFDLPAFRLAGKEANSIGSGQADSRLKDLLQSFALPLKPTIRAMNHHHSHVRGSSVLCIIDPGYFTPHNLDFAVPREHVDRFESFLSRFGWSKMDPVMVRHRHLPESLRSSVLTPLWSLSHFHHGTLTGTITVSTPQRFCDQPTSALFSARSTATMNIVTHFGIISLYPKLTASRIGFFVSRPPRSRSDRELIEKMQLRHFRLYDHSRLESILGPHVCTVDPECCLTTRSLFDKGVFLAKLGPHVRKDRETLLAQLHTTLIWRLNTGHCHYYTCDTQSFLVDDHDLYPQI
ncbi:hypothetical protein BKA70DRAFT_1450901 [Coprinopsis sp. MPI-PUGE-AT-0042]|nr:hypothetical protein BKA70DRAFT_1450901 [Coprinopsis sp. MPI-PUGE-AT-0042]